MRHRVYGKHLGRTRNERQALFKNLVQSLITFEKIETTEAKAKAIKGLVDSIITSAKSPNTRKLVTQFLNKKETQEKLFNEIVPRLGVRTSGFTSITKLGRRPGDGSMVVSMRLLLEEGTVKGKVSKEVKVSKVSSASAESFAKATDSKKATVDKKGKEEVTEEAKEESRVESLESSEKEAETKKGKKVS